MAKDLFSQQAKAYAKYRPTYPTELFNYIISFVNEKNCAWDCATGNGQAAQILAHHFRKVEATDISEAQLQQAIPKQNIRYSVGTAEQTLFADNSFDLITVATAYHWFNWKEFYTEATRVGKNGCVVAVWAYNLFSCADGVVNNIIHNFYYIIVAPYWDEERKHVEQAYQTVEFDFNPLPSKDFDIVLHWGKEEFLGYLSSWSAVQHYTRQNGISPLSLISEELEQAWPGNSSKEFHFPLFLRIGRITK